MADQAFQVLPDGRKIIVFATDFQTHSADEVFLCCGLNHQCLAESTLCICGDNRENYFSAKKHKRGCKFDESKAYGSRSHLDYDGSDFDLDAFAAGFAAKAPKAEKSGRKNTGTGTGGPTEDDPSAFEKPFERIGRKPKSLMDLYYVLVNNDPDAYYGNRLVRDCLCDSRTIDDFLQKGFAGYVAIECTKAQRPEWLENGHPYLYLQTIQDDYSNRATIILNCDNWDLRKEIWEKKISRAPNGTHFVVFGYWRPIPDQADAYEADVYQSKCIEFLAEA